MKIALSLNTIPFRYILLLLVSLVVADGLITQFLIASGIAREGNPLLLNLLTAGNFMPIKIAGALLSGILLANMYRHQPKMALITSCCFIAVYTGIVYWNVIVVGLSFQF